MKIAIQIPIKHRTSTRVPNKNFRDLNGKPLCNWLLDEVAEYMPENYDIYIDSEHDAVMEHFDDKRFKRFKFHKRLDWFASDQANGNHLISQFAHAHPDYHFYFQIYVTAVTLKAEIILEAINALISQPDTYDSTFLVTEETGWIWLNNQALNYDPERSDGLPRSQDATYLKETTGLYGISREAVFRTACRIGNKPLLYRVEPQYALDIDTMDDFHEAQRILKYNNLKHA